MTLAGAVLVPQSLALAAVTPKDSAPAACGTLATAPTKYDHVIWIYEENRSFDQVINNAAAPYMSSLANTCGSTTKYLDNEPYSELNPGGKTVKAHSSYIYIANASGSDCLYGNGIHGVNCLNKQPNQHIFTPVPWNSIYQQVDSSGQTWRSYDESAPTNCSRVDGGGGLYTQGHDPAVHFSNIANECLTNDLTIPGLVCPDGTATCSTPTGPLADDIMNDTLANYSVVIPNLDNDMHNGTVNQADTWLKTYMGLLTASPEYQKGTTAVFVLWDESFSLTKTMPFLAIAPSVHSGIISKQVNGFAVLRAAETMLNLTGPHLGCASGTPPHAAGAAPPTGSQCFPGANTTLRPVFNL